MATSKLRISGVEYITIGDVKIDNVTECVITSVVKTYGLDYVSTMRSANINIKGDINDLDIYIDTLSGYLPSRRLVFVNIHCLEKGIKCECMIKLIEITNSLHKRISELKTVNIELMVFDQITTY